MAKFKAKVGYRQMTEVRPGIWKPVITEKTLRVDLHQNSLQVQQQTEKVNPDLVVQNSVSLIADAYASEHFSAIRYVEWAGTLWEVTSVAIERPRLTLRLGGVYNAPKPAGAPDTP